MHMKMEWNIFLKGTNCIFIAFVVIRVTSTYMISLPACKDLVDSRLSPSQYVSFPMLSEPQTSTFLLLGRVDLKTESSCKHIVEDTVELNTTGNNFMEEKPDVLDVHERTEKFFTEYGHYFDGQFYYRSIPNRFCIKLVSDTSITVRVCKPMCDSSNSFEYCVPKCCDPNEIVAYWAGLCRKLRPEEPSWTPNFSDNKKFKKYYAIYQKNELKCEHGIKRLPFRDVLGPKVEGAHLLEIKEKIKLEVSNGKLQLMHLTEDRKWKEFAVPFCVDGFVVSQNASHTYSNDESDDQVAITCSTHHLNETHSETEEHQTLAEAWVYVAVSIVASFFLLSIVVIYSLLPDKRNFHGLAVLSYSISMLFSYVFYTAAHFVTLFPNEEFTGVGNRGPVCMTIAIGSHYFLYTSFAWLTVINIDLLRKFGSLSVISVNKRLKSFALHSIFAWGIPFVMITSFVIVDEKFRNPLTLIIVPDYAKTSCSVADWSRGYYVYGPLAGILLVNGIITLLTFRVLFRATRNASRATNNGPDRYTATLYLKLFCMMGVGWLFQMISWYYNKENKPWVILVVDIIMHLQAVLLFFLLCCNERTLKKLQSEYPKCSGVIKLLRRLQTFACCQSTSRQRRSTTRSRMFSRMASHNNDSVVVGYVRGTSSVTLTGVAETSL